MTPKVQSAWRALANVVFAGCLLTSVATAQKVTPKSAESAKQVQADAHKLPAERGDVVDRIVAIVNGDLVLESDVDEEERFTELYPYSNADGGSLRDQAIKRLIDRTLILQQMASFPQTPISDDQVKREEADLRKDLPACVHADCSSDAGWEKFLALSGFTEVELRGRLRQRAEVLRFIEQRFRTAVRVTDAQISDFYNKSMIPEYKKQNASPPPLDSVRDRIQELLLQREVSSMLDDWLKALRESGRVRVLQTNVEAP